MLKLPNESISLILQHWKDTTNWNATPEDVTTEPYTKQLEYWWAAKAYYNLDRWYQKFEDIHDPEEGQIYTVWDGKQACQYSWYGDHWGKPQCFDSSFYT